VEPAIDLFDSQHVEELLGSKSERKQDLALYNMTSLNSSLILNKANTKSTFHLANEDTETEKYNKHEISLAFERINCIPQSFIEEVGEHVKILDISHNEFKDFTFLTDLKNLTTLICDHNPINSFTEFPFLPNLECFWLNFCKVNVLYPWIRNLSHSCPKLKFLSLMGNPGVPSFFNGATEDECQEYRCYIVSLWPQLCHLDEKAVTPAEVHAAEKLFPQSFLNQVGQNVEIPKFIRTFSNKVSDLISPPPSFATSQDNLIV